MKYTFILALALTAMTAAGTAEARFPGHGGFGMRGGDIAGRIQFLAEELSLTDAQLDQVESIAQATRAELEPLADEMRALRESVRDIGGINYDAAGIEALATEQGVLVSRMIMAKEAARAQVLAVLTPDQVSTLESLREERGRRRH